MNTKYTTPSTSVSEATNRWIEELGAPQTAVETITKKILRLRLTPQEIDADRIAKLARLKG